MRAVGLITEYNPFHNGHLYHLEQSRKLAGAEVAVAVMSGHFLQRGEPALVDKWVRTQMALAAGVDVVVELPMPFACNSAPHFAAGAVQSLTALGVQTVCFGSESGDLPALQRCAALLEEHAVQIERQTGALLRQGMGYPQARAAVFASIVDAELAALLDTPNNILGLAYLRAISRLALPLQPCTLARLGPGYHDIDVKGGIASATGIRQRLSIGEPIDRLLPAAALLPLQHALAAGQTVDAGLFYRLLLAAILRGGDGYYLGEHGMSQRLQQAAAESVDLETLINAVQAPQWTRTRVQRTLCHLLLGSRADQMSAFLDSGPLYLHLLGASERGRRFLAATRKQRSLPLIDNYSRVYSRLRRFYGRGSAQATLAEAQLAAEINATRMYGLLLGQRPLGGWSRDFTQGCCEGWEKSFRQLDTDQI